ncbi:hypothetical protein BDW68DRAFT_158021 [Aspergillus falconensis]
MVHEIRKQKGYDNCVVYGAVSDGQEFRFLMIDNDTKWCQWTPPDMWTHATKSQIYTMLSLVVRNAVRISPRVSAQAIRRISPTQHLTSEPLKYHVKIGSSREHADDMEL